jgi:hypothetical protein
MQQRHDITPSRAALRDFKPTYVGSGSFSTDSARPRDVGYALGCGHPDLVHALFSDAKTDF